MHTQKILHICMLVSQSVRLCTGVCTGKSAQPAFTINKQCGEVLLTQYLYNTFSTITEKQCAIYLYRAIRSQCFQNVCRDNAVNMGDIPLISVNWDPAF